MLELCNTINFIWHLLLCANQPTISLLPVELQKLVWQELISVEVYIILNAIQTSISIWTNNRHDLSACDYVWRYLSDSYLHEIDYTIILLNHNI